MKRYDNFMTDKEKAYVSNMLRKTILREERIYKYGMFFGLETYNKDNNDKDIIDSNKDNKELINNIKDNQESDKNSKDNVDTQHINIIKQDKNYKSNKKSIKPPRITTEKECSILGEIHLKLLLELIATELLEIKYKDNNIDTNEDRCINHLNSSYFTLFFKIDKFYSILDAMLIYLKDNKEIINLIYKNFRSIRLNDKLKNVLYNNINRIEIDNKYLEEIGFHKTFINSNIGVVLASISVCKENKYNDISNVSSNDNKNTINNKNITIKYYNTIINNINILFDNDYINVWRLLALIANNLDYKRKKVLVAKLKDIMVEIIVNKDEEQINVLNIFLEQIED